MIPVSLPAEVDPSGRSRLYIHLQGKWHVCGGPNGLLHTPIDPDPELRATLEEAERRQRGPSLPVRSRYQPRKPRA